MKVFDLKVNYQNNPIAVDTPAPRFSWKISSDKKEVMQTAYQIIVKYKNDIVWDSGKVLSEQSLYIEYKGDELHSFNRYDVEVSVWDNKNENDTVECYFETAVYNKSDWQGMFITHEFDQEETTCPLFIKDFNIIKKIKKAKLYATACGVYEIMLNNKEVTENIMPPGYTSYNKRLMYQTYDVTQLVSSENNLEITLGNGWYKGVFGLNSTYNLYGDRVAVLAMLRLEYEDGEVEVISTDESFKVYKSQIKYSEIYHGETTDFTSEIEFISNAVEFTPSTTIGKLVSQECGFVKVIEEIKAKELIITPKGEQVIDFGQNLTGLPKIKLPISTSGKLEIYHSETLDKDGNFYTENLRSAKCTDTYIYNENKVGLTVMPLFTFHGFRYIKIVGANNINIDDYTACVMHTDMEQTGYFTSDNKLVNQLQSNIRWGQKGNFLDIPTDCPQRDERLGWTGDAQVFASTAMYNYDTALFFKKWLRDLYADQNMKIGVPHVIPNALGKQGASCAWADAATIIPMTLYNVYGDKEVLYEQYNSMKDWVEYIISKTEENGLWQSGFHFGDWLALDGQSIHGATDIYFIANAYYIKSIENLYKASEILGYDEEANKYKKLYNSVKEKFNDEYVTKNGRLVSETQTSCVLALHFNLVKDCYKEKIVETLEKKLSEKNDHLCTGFVGTPYLCHCLSENGEHGLATKIFLQEDYPSWFYSVKMGATTIWERWNSILPDGSFETAGMNSLNHYAYGSIGSWLYEKVAGISILEAGYKKFEIKPILTKGFSEVSAKFNSVYGEISSEWKIGENGFELKVVIPANTKAIINLPYSIEKIELGSGNYLFSQSS